MTGEFQVLSLHKMTRYTALGECFFQAARFRIRFAVLARQT